MAEYPYTTVPGKIPQLFSKIKYVGIPPKVTQNWLKSIGFRSSNDRSLIPILSFIGMTDSSGVPTESWKRYRSAEGPQVLANCIRRGYEGLFQIYPDAPSRDRKELESFFASHSSVGKQAITKTVSTFLELCKLADFTTAASSVDAEQTPADVRDDNREDFVDMKDRKNQSNYTININIHLAIPETNDPDVYDLFFKALKKHVLDGDA